MLLRQITTHTYYLPGANNIGVISTGNGGAIAVDTGMDREKGRTLRKALDEVGLTLRAIVNTHHHADHIGGNDYLVRNIPDVEVYAPPLEAALIEHPLMQPAYLNYGASPIKALRTRWLLAKGTRVHHLLGDMACITEGRPHPPVEVAGVPLEIIALPGHTMAQIGLVYDGVCFAADGYFGTEVIERHGLLYAHDIAAQRASFARLGMRTEAWLLPGHGDLTPRAALPEVLAANQHATERVCEMVLHALEVPGEATAIAARVRPMLHGQSAGADVPPPMNIPQYAVFAGGISSYLSFLEQQGLARVDLDERGLIWSRRQ